MTQHVNTRGAKPVGHIADLQQVEAAAVLCLRLWCNGPGAQRQVRGDFDGMLGPAAGQAAAAALDDLCQLFARFGRRPVMHHHPSCGCLGADEACFANLVALATEGECEDAALIATLMVRPDVSLRLAASAQTLGIALRRMAIKTDHRWAPRPPGTIH